MALSKHSTFNNVGDYVEDKCIISMASDKIYRDYCCPDCGYQSKVQDILLNCFSPSPRSKHRVPEFYCICGSRLRYVGDLEK
jgi:hypothetical protein